MPVVAVFKAVDLAGNCRMPVVTEMLIE